MAHTARTQSRSSAANPTAAEKKAAAPGKSASRLSPAAAKWVDATLRKMTLDEKIGQLLFATYHGSFTATDSAAYAQMLHCVNDLHVGGFINITQGSPLGIVKSQAYPTAVLTNQLQAQSKLPLLVAADFERGIDSRDQTLCARLFIPGGAIDLASEEQPAHQLGFQRRRQLRGV